MRVFAIFIIAAYFFACEVSAEVECLKPGSSCSDRVTFCLYNELDVIRKCRRTVECQGRREAFYRKENPISLPDLVTTCLTGSPLTPRPGR